jgi:tRNA threonylcarbamoyladenosine biosynthesis protein TsaE
VRGSVTSPTFVVARTHPNSGSGPELVHVDAYRLVSAKELDDLDIDYTHSVVVVEWGKGMLDGVSESWLEVEIERAIGEKGRTELTGLEPVFSELSYDDEGRRVCIKAIGSRWDGNALRSLRALVDLSSCS